VQSINYPTVAVGEERLRITVTPRHTLEQMDKLVRAIDATFKELRIKRLSDWKAVGGCAGVGVPGDLPGPEPIWTEHQIGLDRGAAPRTLRSGAQSVVDVHAVNVARARFNWLLGPVRSEEETSRAVTDKWVNATLKMTTGGVGSVTGHARAKPEFPSARAISASA
jgi:5-aminolevulinate synthase